MDLNQTDCSVSSFVRVEIPTTSEFLKKWNAWIQAKVTKHYKRDKERIPDTAQRVRLRLLSKDFISRWFFKHLTNDLVDLSEMTRMVGSPHANRSARINPVYGDRMDPNSLWRVSDILDYANFDYERYFYSIQNHTIDTNRFLRLLGYGIYNEDSQKYTVESSAYGVLESLYRQGRIKPSELTEHDCTAPTSTKSSNGLCISEGCGAKHFSRGFCKQHYRQFRQNSCSECDRGRVILNQKGVSLSHRWTNPEVIKTVSKLRWNDSQLAPFLREWRKSNLIKSPPRYIMRDPKEATIDAGLLKYANTVVDNDVFNHFKSMIRSDDIANVTLDIKSDPDSTSVDKMYWEMSEIDNSKTAVFIDTGAYDAFLSSEHKFDVNKLMFKAALTDLEINVISKVDLEEISVAEVSSVLGMSLSKVNKIRAAALTKMKEYK